MRQLSTFAIMLLLSLCGTYAGAQNMLITSQNPDELYVCGRDTVFVTFTNSGNAAISGITGRVTLPAGIQYITGSVNGATEQNITNLSAPQFAVASLGVGASQTFWLIVEANCDLVDAINSGQLFTNQIRAVYTGGQDQITTLNYTVETGLLVIVSATPFSLSGQIGDMVFREIKVKNTRLGPIGRVELTDIHFPGYTAESPGATSIFNDVTIFSAVYDGTFFNTVGDMDAFLDFNEEITLIEKITITDCGTPSFDNPSRIRVGWGCNTEVCQYDSTDMELTILESTQNPNIKFIATTNPPLSYCGTEPTLQEMVLINTGAVDATNVSLNLAISLPFNTSGIVPGTFEYNSGSGWISIAPNLANSTTLTECDLPALNGATVIIPLIPANDTTLFRFQSIFCTPTCNQLFGRFYAFTFYNKACPPGSFLVDSIAYQVPDSTIYKINGGVRFEITECLVENQSYNMVHTVKSPVLNTGTGFVQFRLTLPLGIYWDDQCENAVIEGKSPVLTSITPNAEGGTDVLVSYALPFLTDSISMPFCINYICKPGLKCEYIDGSFNPEGGAVTVYPVFCPDSCGLRTYAYVGFTQTPDADLGCGLTRCQNFLLFVEDFCNGGGGGGGGGGALAGVLIDYETYRINYGVKDANDDRLADSNQPPTLSQIRLDRYIPGDTLRFDLKGVVVAAPVGDVSLQIFTESLASDFGLADGDAFFLTLPGANVFTNKDSLELVRSFIRIKTADGMESTCPSNVIDYDHKRLITVSTINEQPPGTQDRFMTTNRRFSLPFATCSPTGEALQLGDSVFFVFEYRFNQNYVPLMQNTTQLPPPLINFRNVPWVGEYAWKTPEEYGFPRPLSQYSGYTRTRTFPRHTIRPCSTSFQQTPFAYGIRIARGNMFPFEVRQISEITRFELEIPAGPVLQGAVTNLVLQENTPFKTNQAMTWTQTVNKLMFDYNLVFDQLVDEGFNMRTDLIYEPSCNYSGPDTTYTEYDVMYPEGFPLQTVITTKRKDPIGLIDALPLLVPDFGPTNITLSTPNFQVDFLLRNTRPSPAPNAWIYVNPINGNLDDVEILRMPAGTPLPGIGGLFQLGEVGLLANIPLRITAANGNCEGLKVELIFGWDCEPTTSPLSSTCGRDTVLLDLRLQNAVLELDVIGQPSEVPLCEPSEYFSFEVSNANAGNAFALTPSIKLPQGLSVVPGSVQISYPSPGGTWVNTSDPNPLPGNIYQWKMADILPALVNGLPGFSTAPSNAFRLRFRVIASCGFVANAQPIYGVEGSQPCGISTNILRKADDPIGLEGVSPSYEVNISLSPASTDPVACGDELEIAVQMQILGLPSPNDSIYLSLPQGVTYVSNSYSPIQNAPTAQPLIQGQNIQVGLPPNLQSGSIVKFNIKVKYDNAAGCLDRFVIAQARQKTQGFCPLTNQNCSVYIATGEALLQLPSSNPDLKLENFSPTATGASGYSFTADISNPGLVTASGVTLQLWLDANGNGLPDTGEQLVQTVNSNQTLSPGNSITINGTINVALEDLCKLLAVLPAAENCACASKYFPLDGFTVNKGTIARCVVEPVSFGVEPIAGHTYTWQPGNLLSCTDCATTTFTPGPTVTPGDAFTFVLTEKSGDCTIDYSYSVLFGNVLGIETPNQAICRGDSVKLSATPGGTYNWSGPGVVQGAQTQTVSPTSTTNYAVTVTFAAGCTGTDVVQVTVLSPTNLDLGVVKTCAGVPVNIFGQPRTDPGVYTSTVPKANGCDSTLTIRLEVVPIAGTTLVNVCAGGIAVVFGDTVTQNGVFTQFFTNSLGCDSTHTVTVKFIPAIAVPPIPRTRIEEGDSTQLTGPPGFASYGWSPSAGLSCSDCQNPIASPDTSTTYILTVTDANGCTDTVGARVVVVPPCFQDFKVPNAFTPDGDGENERFGALPLERLEVVTKLTIYNRWGQKIFESTTDPYWDGTVDGKAAPVDTYLYIMELECNGKTLKWDEHQVTLLR